MTTRAEILAALDQVMDPELGQSIVALGMVDGIDVGPDGAVEVTVALTISGCPLRHEIQAAAATAVQAVAGVTTARINLATMSAERRQALFARRASAPGPEAPVPRPECAGPQAAVAHATLPMGAIPIAIASGKGGVGKSSVTVNLAAALTAMGFQVGIADCDIYGASIPHMLGIQDWRLPVVNDQILPVSAGGIRVVSIDFFQEGNRPVIWRGPMLSRALNTFFQGVRWGELDFLLLDLPPGTGDVALDIHQLLPQCREILVTTPHPTAAYVAHRAGMMAREAGHEILGVVENMAFYRSRETGQPEYVFGQGGGDRLAAELGVPLLARVPLGGERADGTEVYAGETEAAAAFSQVAEQVAGQTAKVRARLASAQQA